MAQPGVETGCGQCGGHGVILTGETAMRCSCMDQYALLRLFARSQLTATMRRQTFDSFQTKYYSGQCREGNGQKSYLEMAIAAREACRELVAGCLCGQVDRGLMLTGPVGCGKTLLATAVCNELLANRVAVLFVVVPDLLDQVRSTFDHSGGDGLRESDLMNAAREAPVLILDDLGAHNYTPWSCNLIYSLINYRLIHNLPTVVTTNLTLAEMEAYLGERTTSRIIQLCRVYRLNVERDIRRVKNAEDRQTT